MMKPMPVARSDSAAKPAVKTNPIASAAKDGDGVAVAGDQERSDRIARHAEQPGMAERHQAGVTDQDVQPEREDRVEQNLAGDIDVIGLGDRIRHRDQRQDRDSDGDAAGDHSTCPPNRPCGRNTSTSTIGRNRMK